MRIYFDENFSPSLIKGIQAFQNERTSDDVIACSIIDEFGRGARDEEWIPAIASKHGVVITQDLNIHRLKAQAELCSSNKIGIVFFKPPKKTGWGYWQIVQLVVKWWPEICKLSKETKRPFAFIVESHVNKIKPI